MVLSFAIEALLKEIDAYESLLLLFASSLTPSALSVPIQTQI
jgi:hypothetical protein